MKHRLFIGLQLPEPVLQEVVLLQKTLEERQLPIVMEPPEKIHLTLNFIGAVEKDKIPSLETGIRHVCLKHHPFTITPEFLETLYKKHATSIIYLGLSGQTDELKAFQKDLSTAFIQQQIPQPHRFLPHFTIAKVKKADPVITKSVLDEINSVDISPLPEFTVAKIVLFESFVSRVGSHYQKVRQFMLE